MTTLRLLLFMLAMFSGYCHWVEGRPPIVLHFDSPRLLRSALRRLSTSTSAPNRPINLTIDMSSDDGNNWDNILPAPSPNSSTSTSTVIDTLRIGGTTRQLPKIQGIITQLTTNRVNATKETSINFTIPDEDFNNQSFEIDVTPLWETLSRVNSVQISFLHANCSSRIKIRLPMTPPIHSLPFLQFTSKCKLCFKSTPPCRDYAYQRIGGVGIVTMNLCQCSSFGCH